MKIKVIHTDCGTQFDATWGKQEFKCPGCKKIINIKDVRMADGEVMRLFQ